MKVSVKFLLPEFSILLFFHPDLFLPMPPRQSLPERIQNIKQSMLYPDMRSRGISKKEYLKNEMET
jgi:hypothetical protein